ncbi:hypothetical protein L1049_021713 [Liquidambar formosana]|uniref:Uncharacterized protein n=1 Tax=Liquidambar formosana TaxID=63359 RepID=A0AAP0WPX4_LIQFO
MVSRGLYAFTLVVKLDFKEGPSLSCALYCSIALTLTLFCANPISTDISAFWKPMLTDCGIYRGALLYTVELKTSMRTLSLRIVFFAFAFCSEGAIIDCDPKSSVHPVA